MKRGFGFIIILMLLCLIGLYKTYEKKFIEPNLDKELKEQATPEYLTQKILKALKNNNLQEANIYKNLADYLNIELNSSIINRLENENSYINSKIRDIKSFTKGFFTGEMSDTSSLVGSIVSDMTVVGDIRDIYIQTDKMYQNKEYDKFTLGLSIIGVALTATTILTIGGTTSTKVGISILKVAKKSGSLTKSFSRILVKSLNKTINFKKIDFSNLKSIHKAINQRELIRLEKNLNNINNIKKYTSTVHTLNLLKYVKDEKDLHKVTKIVQKYKKNSIGVLKVLGKSALRGGKWVVKVSMEFIYFLIGFLISFLMFIFTLVSFYKKFRASS